MLRSWSEQDVPFEEIRVYTRGVLDIPIPAKPFIRFECIGPSVPAALWEHIVLPLRKPRDDLFFCPGYVVPLLSREHPVVVTHHGSYEAIPEAFPWWSRTRARAVYQLSCNRADAVITVSMSSKRDIIRFYGTPAERIHVIPMGVDDAFRPIEDPERLAARRQCYFADGRPYVLFVGKFSARRHVPDLLAAFANLMSRRNLPHGLVLIGPDTTGQQVLAQAVALRIESRVVHKQFATHEELAEAYNAADVFIYPSDYEGFGMPVLESLACGTPAITLNNSAFPEFAGGIAYFARDGSAAALEDALETVIYSSEQRSMTRNQGPKRAESYRWPLIARRTMGVLRDVAQSG